MTLTAVLTHSTNKGAITMPQVPLMTRGNVMHRSLDRPVHRRLALLLGVLAAAVIPATAAAAPLATSPPVNTVAPQIQQPPGAKRQNEVAAPMVGEFLLGSKGTWTGASYFKVQWEDCDNVGLPTQTCTAAAGSPSTNTTYQVAAGDVGHALVFLVTAYSSPSSSTPVSSAASGAVAFGAPLNRLAPVISGLTQDGQTLSVTSGTWDTGGTNAPPTFGYQWRRCDGAGLNCGKALPISPSPSPNYALTDGDLGHILVAYVTATSTWPGGSASDSTHSHLTTTVVTPGNTAAPTVSGTAQAGQKLTESHGSWIPKSPTGYSYQWQDCDASGANCSAIAGATAQTYTPTNADVGHTLRVLESATASGVTSSPATSAATGVVKAGSTAGGGGGGTGGGTTGGGTTGGQGGSGGTVTLSASKIRGLLRNVLALHGKAGTIRGVLNHAGYSFSFTAPSSGRLVLDWYFAPKHGKKVLVAAVTLVFHSSGKATAKIALTDKGRRVLSGTRRMKLTAKGSFAPAGHGAVSTSRQITLKA
jgi:hypothetical protein